jgi:hypothetical protein
MSVEMTTTIAQQLKIKDFPFVINDKDGNSIYWEESNNFWIKREWDAHGNIIRYESSNDYWSKSEYGAHGNEIYYENSNNYWRKREYDANGNEIYYENSKGRIIDNRPKQVEMTLQQIADKMGIKVEQLRIKD